MRERNARAEMVEWRWVNVISGCHG
jgi:hypothetical protein